MGKNRFSATKIVGTCDFHRIFDKISKRTLISIYIPSYNHISYQIYFFCLRQNRNHGVSAPPLPKNFDDSPTHTTQMRYRVSIDYIIAIWQPSVDPKKLPAKNHRGVATTPLRRTRVNPWYIHYNINIFFCKPMIDISPYESKTTSSQVLFFTAKQHVGRIEELTQSYTFTLTPTPPPAPTHSPKSYLSLTIKRWKLFWILFIPHVQVSVHSFHDAFFSLIRKYYYS